MSSSSTLGPRPGRTRRVSVAGVAAAGAAAAAVSLVPGVAAAAPAKEAVAPSPVATGTASPVAFSTQAEGAQVGTLRDGIGGQQTTLLPAPAQAPADRAVAVAPSEAPESDSASSEPGQESAEPQEPEYPDNLDGWIREALAIMDEHDIPGSYEGIHRNILRESSGDPNAINTWDINARNGVPSKGLLQVIQPTFDAYHVEGTPYDLYDPVANIVAACNYAADRYGSMDNVWGPY
ncbi:transglycosylase SLT domain-containing protein [Streptomyces marincola]|uniref:transglycosylase SLT domain-containing protein n=1 Tax=Streptomyces marincola TaxID=2878388 RepID=UPI001CF48CDC|nr:transglycosylase SLT domain-containing protein [Streptomyces marincola]UCM91588.1 transglycosylase SLT domain-containing protein [Streptomyces marincola]